MLKINIVLFETNPKWTWLGDSNRSVCPDTTALHITESLGSGGSSSATELVTDQPDALRPQQSGLP